MYLRDLGASLLRRWPLVIVGLLLSAGLAYAAFTLVPLSWTAKASVLLLPPSSVVGVNGNPYLFLGGLEQAADVLVRRLDTEAAHTQAKDRYDDGDFTVQIDGGSAAPIILIEAEAPDAASALSLLDDVYSRVPPELLAMQQDLGAAQNAFITATDITVDAEATLNPKTRIQLTAIAGAVGLALTVLLTGLVDGLARRRRQSQDEAAQTELEDPKTA